jgi:hypothetical protein
MIKFNPEKKMKRRYLPFFLLFVSSLVFAGQVIPLPGLLKPQRIYIDQEQCFITEGATIYIYSLKDFKLQKKFGKRGEGPGEFRESGEGIKLDFKPEKIIVTSTGRFSYFTRDGQFIKEARISNPRRFEFQELGSGFVGKELLVEKKRVFITVNLIDKNLKKIKEIYRFKHPFYPRSKPINPVFLRTGTYYVYQDKIFYDDEDGIIHVLDGSGKELYLIRPQYERVKIKDIHKIRYLMFWRTDLRTEYAVFKDRLKFPAAFPPIRNFHIVDNKIYVVTYKEKDNQCWMLVFDLGGKLLKEVFVSLVDINMLIPDLYNYYTIHEDKLYILRDNQDTEEWELHIDPMARGTANLAM